MRRARRLRQVAADDAGFTLVELLAAMVVFAIMSSAVIYALIAAAASTRGGRNRVVAANLLQQTMEQLRIAALRSGGLASIALGTTSCTGSACPLSAVVDNVPYTIRQTARWVASSTATSACSPGGSSRYAFLRVSLKATWPDIGATRPVRSDSLFTPALGDTDLATGSLPVQILDAAGQPVSDVPVGLTAVSGGAVAPAPQTTDESGCALFAYLPAGGYVATSSASGSLIDYYGSPTHVSPATVVTVGVQTSPLIWGLDNAASASFGAVADIGAPTALPPASLNARISNATPNPSLRQPVTGDATGAFTASPLFPFVGGDTVWLGSCDDASPVVNGGSTGPSLPLTAGAPSTRVKGRAVSISVRKVLGGASVGPGARVFAIHSVGGGCAGAVDPTGTAVGESYDLGVTDAAGKLTTVLPYGPSWKFRAKTTTGPWGATSAGIPLSAAAVALPTPVTVTAP